MQNSCRSFETRGNLKKSATWENYGEFQRPTALRNASLSPGTRGLMGTTDGDATPTCVSACVLAYLRTCVRAYVLYARIPLRDISSRSGADGEEHTNTVDSLSIVRSPRIHSSTFYNNSDFAPQRFCLDVRQTCIRMYRFIPQYRFPLLFFSSPREIKMFKILLFLT